MVVAYGQQHFVSVEAPSVYVPPQPGSHANRVGLYSDELVAAPNPRVGEEVGVVCASLSLACCRGAALTACTRSSRKQTDDEVDNGCTRCPLAAEQRHQP
jgi:hypothetical protein